MTPLEIDRLDIHARLMVKEALRRDYSIHRVDHTYPENLLSPVILAQKNGKKFLLSEAVSNLTSHFGRNIAKDKIRTYDLLSRDDLPIPETLILRRGETIDEKALDFLEEYKTIVVKPSNTNHGKGISIGISNREELGRAVEYATSQSQNADILLQQTAPGREFRFLVLGDKVIAVANRRPPSVTGDGTKTIDQLIDDKNANPSRGSAHSAAMTRIRKNEVVHFLGKNILQKVPEKNQQVELLKTSNLSRGGESTNYTDLASDELKAIAVKAAKSCFLEFAGVDIMTTDINTGHVANCKIIEVNASPGIRMHQLPSYGQPVDVAAKIFDYLEDSKR